MKKNSIHLFTCLGYLFSGTVLTALVDDNGNGLSDVWEQLYNTNALQLLGDEDGDGFSNVEECIAGTDPHDAEDRPQLVPSVVQDNNDEINLSFQTIEGKSYQIFYSNDLTNFNPITEAAWPGDGATRELRIRKSEASETLSLVQAHFWADIAATSIDDLTGVSGFPLSPDGVAYQLDPSGPEFQATGYGARMRFAVTPPETGLYTFFLSAGGPAELYFSSKVSYAETTKIAEILPAQVGLKSKEWDTYETQRADPVNLVAGESYYFELRYVGAVPSQHTELAWSGPGLDGIVQLDRSHLAKRIFNPGDPIFVHDYDSPGQTGLIWPDNSVIETGVAGMSGNAQRLTGDPGLSNADERIAMDGRASSHFYATWLFNMATGHNDTNVVFMNDLDFSQEGPRINLEELNSGSVASVRAGGVNGNQIRIDVAFNQTFRVEIVGSLAAEGFDYKTPLGSVTAAVDTFDIYVSDTSGTLIGSATGLAFRDGGTGVVDSLSTLNLAFSTDPNIAFDAWEITNGEIAGNGYLESNLVDFSSGSSFFKMEIAEEDQDGDGIADWEELALAPYYEFLFFDAETNDGTPDADALLALLSGAQGTPVVSLYGTDAAAFESNYPNTIEDNGQLVISRTGVLTPLTVSICVPPLVETGSTATVCDGTCCMLIGSAGDEEAEPEDYVLIEADGTIVTDSVTFDFGETTKVLTLKAINDSINEYPETVNLAIQVPTDGSYTISTTQNGASIQIFDLPESPDNLTIFTGAFTKDGAALPASNVTATGSVTATINGPRTEIRLWNDFSGLTSAQTTSHVHKASVGSLDSERVGAVVFAITEQNNEGETVQLLGPLTNHVWDLTTSAGATSSNNTGGSVETSKQILIDSLFGQNGETPLYLNIHTAINTGGEIWAFLGLSEGSTEDPGDAPAAALPGTTGYEQITGDLLEVEVRRFLNQATFGATDAAVAEMVNNIETERLSNPAYHRYTEYEKWIDDQMNQAVFDQTYLLDYGLASFYQLFTLAGLFDASRYPNPLGLTIDAPERPTEWPTVDRSEPDPAHWYLSSNFPVTFDDFQQASDGGLGFSRNFSSDFRTGVHWQMMLNAKDQLRQKMGYALQQIVVVSFEENVIEQNFYGALNYQDMINTYAFSYYRDVLGFVNWSPVMGLWLSSIRNQKAIDFDGDGLFDSYPDENLARENMQLFSIGLFDLWTDGTLKLTSEGLPRQTYTNEDIKEFARILTGQSFSTHAGTSSVPTWGGPDSFIPSNTNFNAFTGIGGHLSRSYLYPMRMFGEYHSLGSKSFAGVTIDNSHITDLELQAEADIESAIDWLAGKPGDGLPDFDMVHSHISTPAFISRRLIQRFTTSNPSREYLHRVATVFKNSEGNLGQTLKAILLDPEARQIDLSNTTFGLKKSPLEAYIQMLRSLEAHTHVALYDPQGAAPYDVAAGDFSNPDLYLETYSYPAAQKANFERNARFLMRSSFGTGSSGLQMSPFSQLTVFNYYVPDFNPGGVIGAEGLVAPEFQLANEPDIIRNINYFEDIIRSNEGPSGDELGLNDANQVLAFGSDPAADRNDFVRLGRQSLADTFYPATEPDSGITHASDGLTISQSGGGTLSAPHWVRLTRVGDQFTSSQSVDGVTWVDVQTWTLPFADELYVGLAVTSHNDGVLTTAVFDDVSITGANGIWNNKDIGDVAAFGSLNVNMMGEYEIQASGADIWHLRDEFHFVYQVLSGDGVITAQVKSLVNTDQWAKAGVMMRETLESDSANVFTLLSASNGCRAQRRDTTIGRSSESLADEAMLDELDLRLTNGYFKMRYPYDVSDNDDPSSPGVDDFLKNPRELIIDAITAAYGDPYDATNGAANRRNKFSDALYLLTFSPEYQIKK